MSSDISTREITEKDEELIKNYIDNLEKDEKKKIKKNIEDKKKMNKAIKRVVGDIMKFK